MTKEKKIIIGSVVAGVVIILIVLLALLGGNKSREKQEEASQKTAQEAERETEEKAKMPNVLGMTEADARSELANAGLGAEIITVYSDTVEAGKVISASMEAGTETEKDSSITVTVSMGKEYILMEVPDLSNVKQEDALKMLEEAGLQVGAVSEEFHDTVAKGCIISQSQLVGLKVEEGTTVDMVVSKGKSAVVPDCAGMTQEEAYAVLNNMYQEKGWTSQIEVVKVQRESDSDDVVLSMEPKAGTLIGEGQKVVIQVLESTKEESKKEEIKGDITAEGYFSLNAVGMPVGEAIKAFASAGFFSYTKYEWTENVPNGIVIDQKVEVIDEENVKKVTLTVSEGRIGLRVRVPWLGGKPETEARKALEDLGLVVVVKYTGSGLDTKGIVHDQIGEGYAEKGETITLWVGRGYY